MRGLLERLEKSKPLFERGGRLEKLQPLYEANDTKGDWRILSATTAR